MGQGRLWTIVVVSLVLKVVIHKGNGSRC